MRDHLYGTAQVVAAALTLDDVPVDFASRDVVLTRERDVEVALVVPKVEVNLAAVVENEDFAVPNFSKRILRGWFYKRTRWRIS